MPTLASWLGAGGGRRAAGESIQANWTAAARMMIQNHTSGTMMRTIIDIEDGLIAEAMATTRLPTKRAAVEEALQLVRRRRQQGAIEDG
jgi:Arc/MetJ family transcription regulator